MKPKELVALLARVGFVFARQRGSHALYRRQEDGALVVVPMHNRDIPPGTLHAILKDAGLK